MNGGTRWRGRKSRRVGGRARAAKITKGLSGAEEKEAIFSVEFTLIPGGTGEKETFGVPGAGPG